MPKRKTRRFVPRTGGGKFFAVLIVLVVAGVAAYYIYGAVTKDDASQVTYTTATAETTTLTSSVTGEGNIEWLSTSDITTTRSGTVSDLLVAAGDVVEEDQHLFVVKTTRGSYWISAPIAGTITALSIADDDEISSSSGSSASASSSSTEAATDPIGTIIDLDAFQAVITVSESDLPAVKVGQKAVLTFDALPDLTLTGRVKSIAYTATNSSGVVSYEVVVTPDASNENIRGGMSVSVSIITETAADVLAVPIAAVKTASDGSNYVQILGDDGQPTDVTVETGMTTDSYVQIVSGLTEGQEIVVSTVTADSSSASDTSSQRNQSSLLDGGEMQGGLQGGDFPSGGPQGGMTPPGQ